MTHTQQEISPPCSTSSTCSSTPTPTKSVQFSRFIKISFTYPGDEYDRSALVPAKLSDSEASELIQMRKHWKQEMDTHTTDLIQDPESPEFSPCSSPQEPHHPFVGRIHTHSLLQPASSTTSPLSPPCSPVLSHNDSSSSSEDEYDPSGSSQRPFSSLTPQQQQQYQRLKRFGGSRNGMSGMMQRHSHLDQTKANVQCLA
ncbi:hypothetical protein BGZ79_002414 [Entomortierella chlamydospora]|nr:hypothetical protein BGZ79_002414 [Entomortierella chlamydospora]